MKLYIKYCGGCNPTINRKKLVAEVVNKLKQCTDLELSGEDGDVGLIVGGCTVCCVNVEDIKTKARSFVVVGGELVNCITVPPDKQSDLIVEQILQSYSEAAPRLVPGNYDLAAENPVNHLRSGLLV